MTTGQLVCPLCGRVDVYSVEIRGVYDGTCYWLCPSCDVWWHRFPAGDRRREAVARAMTGSSRTEVNR